jgi:hypothetical protein
VAACDFIGYLISLVLLGVKKCVQVENFWASQKTHKAQFLS